MRLLPTEKILVPFDLSDQSLKAVDTALQIANGSSEVHVIHVLNEMQVADPGVVWQTIDNENRAHHAKDAIHRRLTPSRCDKVKVEIEFGDPGHQVADFAEKNHIDLIVIPSQGRTGLSRLLIGSVAERVTRLAHCPVLVLRE